MRHRVVEGCRPKAVLARLFLSSSIVLVANPVTALEADRSQPMDIQADSLETEINEGKATLQGNVRITQGSLKVASARADVQQNSDREVTRAVLEGAPATLGQDLDDGGRVDARARVIDYDVAAGVIVLTGAVEIDQPRGTLRGERITYNLNTGQLTGGGTDAPGRVSLRINPKPAAAAAD